MPEINFNHSDEELKEITREIMEALRPKHLTVRQIRKIGCYLGEFTENIVLRESPIDEE